MSKPEVKKYHLCTRANYVATVILDEKAVQNYQSTFWLLGGGGLSTWTCPQLVDFRNFRVLLSSFQESSWLEDTQPTSVQYPNGYGVHRWFEYQIKRVTPSFLNLSHLLAKSRPGGTGLSYSSHSRRVVLRPHKRQLSSTALHTTERGVEHRGKSQVHNYLSLSYDQIDWERTHHKHHG